MPPIQSYVSDDLHHFVGRKLDGKPEEAYEILKTILKNKRLLPGGPQGGIPGRRISFNPSGSWRGETPEEMLVTPHATCFCDIPADDLHIHIQKYGPFGLSFKKQDLVKSGARPVVYIPLDGDERGVHGHGLLDHIEAVYKAFGRLVVDPIPEKPKSTSRYIFNEPSSAEEAQIAIHDILTEEYWAFVKYFWAGLEDDHQEQYYMEREWRLISDFQFELHQVHRVFLPEAYGGRLREDVREYCGQVTFTE